MRAAEAVELALRELSPEAQVQNTDVLTLATPVFRRVYAQSYLEMVSRAPHLVGLFYDLTDKAARHDTRAHKLKLLVQRMSLRPLEKLLRSRPWDVVVNTHFLPPELVAGLRRSGRISTPQVTVVTDLEAHGMWVHEPTELYFTATPEAGLILERWGVHAAQITRTGIPIHPIFSKPKDPMACRARLGLSPKESERPIVMILGGGFGLGPMESLLTSVLEAKTPLHAVCVCGRNSRLKERLERVPVPARHRATLTGFTREIDEFMAAADIVVTKPGGLTTSEILARGTAMLIVNPIPGQESRNSDWLLENGAAMKINALPVLAYKLDTLLADRSRLAELRGNAKRLGRPGAGAAVARTVLDMVGAS